MRIKGFFLGETLVAFAVFGMVLVGCAVAFLSGRVAWEMRQPMDAQAQAKAVLGFMARDLVLAGSGHVLTQKPGAMVFTFDHPKEGVVAYTWRKDPVTGTGEVLRRTGFHSRVIARNIAALSISGEGGDRTIKVTASCETASGVTDTMSLTENVGLYE